DYTLLTGGVAVVGDTIEYFVVAQDASDNLGSSPAFATASSNPPVPNVNAHGAVNSFTIVPVLSGIKTVGVGGDYSSLSGAGGLFEAINGAVLTGDLLVSLSSDVNENGSSSLNSWIEEGAGNYTLTIQPDSATVRTLSGDAANGLITLNGADHVIIDGSFGGGGRYLTFRNIGVGSTILFTNDACGNTVRNCIVEGAAPYAVVGVIGFGAGVMTGNDDNLITGCQVRDLSTAAGVPLVLIGSVGTSAAVANSNNTVANCELFNFMLDGIFTGSPGNEMWTVSANEIHEADATAHDGYGISMQSAGANIIAGNFIHDLPSTSTSAGISFYGTGPGTTTIASNRITMLDVDGAESFVSGIVLNGDANLAVNVVNNQITLSPASPVSAIFLGIVDDSAVGSVVNVFYNSVVIGGVANGAASSWAALREAASTHTARNNLFLNFRTGGGVGHYAVGCHYVGGGYTLGNNVYAGTGTTSANFMDYSSTNNPVPMDFVAWQSTAGDSNSLAGIAGSGDYTTAMFVSAVTGDLHLLPGGSPLVNATGIPVAGVTDDYDGDLRSLTTPSIGADEAVAAAGIASWRQQYFGITTNTGNAADSFDFDKDGLPNLIEWACNLNPTTASPPPAGAVRNGANLEFTYTRSVAALNAGAVFTVEWSDTLANDWQSTGVSEAILSDNGSVQQVKATLPAGSAGHRFMHLKVTAPP
ncbi:MAG: hypothetical protein WAW39_18100, partial [Prosthecobacter sp.]